MDLSNKPSKLRTGSMEIFDSGAPLSPSGAQTLKEQEQERQRLSKENFNLKLKVFHLEERIQKIKPGHGEIDEDLESELLQYKIALEEKNNEFEEKNALLVKARHMIDDLHVKIQSLEVKAKFDEEHAKSTGKEAEALKSLTAKIHQMEAKDVELLQQINDLSNDNRQKQQQLMALEEKNNILLQNRSSSSAQLEELTGELYSLREQVARNAGAIEAKGILEEALRTKEREISRLLAELDDLKMDNTHNLDKIKELNFKLKSASENTEKADELHKQISELKKQIAERNLSEQVLGEQLSEKTKLFLGSKQSLSECEKMKSSLEESNRQWQQAHETWKKRESALVASVNELETKLTKMNDELRETCGLLQDLQNKYELEQLNTRRLKKTLENHYIDHQQEIIYEKHRTIVQQYKKELEENKMYYEDKLSRKTKETEELTDHLKDIEGKAERIARQYDELKEKTEQQLKAISFGGVAFDLNAKIPIAKQLQEFLDKEVVNASRKIMDTFETKLQQQKSRLEQIVSKLKDIEAINTRLQEEKMVKASLISSLQSQIVTDKQLADRKEEKTLKDVEFLKGELARLKEIERDELKDFRRDNSTYKVYEIQREFHIRERNLQQQIESLKEHNHYLILQFEQHKAILQKQSNTLKLKEKDLEELYQANLILKQHIGIRDQRLEDYQKIASHLEERQNAVKAVDDSQSAVNGLLRSGQGVAIDKTEHGGLSKLSNIAIYATEMEKILGRVEGLVKETHSFYEHYTKLRATSAEMREPPTWLADVERRCYTLHDHNARLSIELRNLTRKVMTMIELSGGRDMARTTRHPSFSALNKEVSYDKEPYESFISQEKASRNHLARSDDLTRSSDRMQAAIAPSSGVQRLQNVYGAASSTLQNIGSHASMRSSNYRGDFS